MQGIEGQIQTAGTSTLEIEVERGPLAGQRLSLQGELRIGSGEEGAATLNDPWLSPSHALIYPSAEGWVVEDLRSVEGTRVSGRPVRGAVTLRAGDTIELGSTRLVVLPDGLGSLDDLPDRQAERAAAELKSEDRRKLDTRRVLAVLLDGLVLAPFGYLVAAYAGSSLVVAIAVIALELTHFFLA